MIPPDVSVGLLQDSERKVDDDDTGTCAGKELPTADLCDEEKLHSKPNKLERKVAHATKQMNHLFVDFRTVLNKQRQRAQEKWKRVERMYREQPTTRQEQIMFFISTVLGTLVFFVLFEWYVCLFEHSLNGRMSKFIVTVFVCA